MRRYGSESNARWEGFAHRPDDIVISTRSKCGTTWMQMICALLVHQDPDLPAPLGLLSPWLDRPDEPVEEVRRRLDAQDHRRIIKTHTPLDGLPLDPSVTYVVVGRHPLDVAVSMYHHVANLDQDRVAELRGTEPRTPVTVGLDVWVDRWNDDAVDPIGGELDTLVGNLHHLADAWDRRDQPNVVLVHYEDLTADLAGEMARLADRLGIEVPAARWPALVEAATFGAMRARSSDTVPDHLGILRDHDAFFRSGRVGEGRARCSPEQVARHDAGVAARVAPDLAAWLVRG